MSWHVLFVVNVFFWFWWGNLVYAAHQILWRYLKKRLSYGHFPLSKLRPSAILDFVTGQKWRHGTLRTVHVYHLAKFGCNISNGGRVIFLTFGLKLPNHARLWGFYGVFDTLNNLFLIEILKRPWVNPRRLRYKSWKSVHWFLLEATTRKRKGKVSYNLRLYFRYMGSGPPWTDFYENWQG